MHQRSSRRELSHSLKNPLILSTLHSHTRHSAIHVYLLMIMVNQTFSLQFIEARTRLDEDLGTNRTVLGAFATLNE